MAFGFLTDKEAREKIAALEADIEQRENEITALKDRAETAESALETATAELAELKEQVENRDTLLAEQEAKAAQSAEYIAQLESERDTMAAKIAELEAKAEVTPDKVSEQAAVMLASQGHPPLELSGDTTGEAKDVLAELASLKGDAKTKFYNEHVKEIKAVLRKLNS